MKGGRLNWQNFIRGFLVCTLIFGAMTLFLTIATSPEKGMFAIIAYYLSTFLFIGGCATIVGFFIRRWWNHNEVMYSNVKTSIRQGFLFAALLTAMLILSAMRLLTWWDASIMVVCAILIELYFKTRS